MIDTNSNIDSSTLLIIVSANSNFNDDYSKTEEISTDNQGVRNEF